MNTRAIPLAVPSRSLAYVALTKPDVSFLVVLTTLAGEQCSDRRHLSRFVRRR